MKFSGKDHKESGSLRVRRGDESRKNRVRRVRARIGFLVAFFFVVSAVAPFAAGITAMAEAGDAAAQDPTEYIPSYQGQPIITGYTAYLGGRTASNATERFYYSDGYFSEPATVYDTHLATMSLCFAGSAMAAEEGGSTSYMNKSVNARELLDHIGCRDICVNGDFVKKPGEDTIGVVMGRKTIQFDDGEYTLIPIGIRGAGYEQEWIGNMKVGSTGDAEGFRTAVDRAKEAVDAYLKTYAIDPERTKFWIAGFSRAGAVTDLLTAALTDAYDPTGARVYGYSFATPQGAYQKARSYPNSHCTVNRSDPVPKVVPTYMGFSHYGDETYYDDPANSFQAYRMSISYIVDFAFVTVPDKIEFTPWDGGMWTQEAFLNKLLEALQATIIPDRDTFTKKKVEGSYTYEEVMSYLIKFVMTADSAHLHDIAESMKEFTQYVSGTALLETGAAKKAVEQGIDNIDPEKKEDIYAVLWYCFKPCFKKSMTEKELATIGSMWKPIMYALFEIAHYDYETSGADGFALIGSLIKNISLLGEAHTPEKYFSLVKPQDDFYQEENGEIFTKKDPAFRVEEASRVQVVVKKNRVPVTSILGGYTQASKDPAVYAGRLSDAGSDLKPDADQLLYTNPDTTDERGVYFDGGGDYQVEVIARDPEDGTVFKNWVDETGVPISSAESYTFSVTQGEPSLRSIRPVYQKPPGEIHAPEKEEKPVQPRIPESGTPWIWISIGAGAVAVGGTAGAFWWRKKRRAGRRRFRKRKK